MKKDLTNEQLPAPVIARGDSPRDRVMRHVRDALAAGAGAMLLTSCPPFGVVDPLPPPAQCRSTPADRLTSAVATVEPADSGVPSRIRVMLEWTFESGLQGRSGATVTGGTLISQSGNEIFVVEPDAGANTFDLVVPVTCDDDHSGPTDSRVKVTVTLGGPGGPTTTVSLD